MEPSAISDGLSALNVGVLAGIALVGYLVAHVLFDRRDLHG
jgi:hypothetical protein